MLGTPLSVILPLALAGPGTDDGAPPSTVGVPGGRVRVGSDPSEVEDLILANEEIAAVFAGETPAMTVEVEDCYLGVTEVTNEQYAEFVQATGWKPPYLWGSDALETARRDFLAEQAKKRAEARARGERYEKRLFDEEAWWAKNWQTTEWKVPEDRLAHPVTFITYADAEAYAHWAGLRLMTEFEFQRACRGDGKARYPWGDEWRPDLAHSRESGVDDTAVVGSYPAVNGIFDLVGNVWEWTSSPYTAYKGYKPLTFKVRERGGRRTLRVTANFDPDKRVLVGGSFKQGPEGLRVTTRQPTSRGQSAEALGFRIAASRQPGLDAAQYLLDDVIDFRVLPPDTDFTPRATLVLERWQTREGEAKAPGYSVVTAYERVLFTPVAKLPYSNHLRDATEEGPAFIGFLATSLPLASPELDANTYLIGFRAAGRLPKSVLEPPGDEESEGLPIISFHEVPGFDAESDCFILYTLDGTPQVAFATRPPAYERMKPGSIALEPYVPPTPEERKALEKAGKPLPKPFDTVRVRFTIPGKKKSRGFTFDLPLQFKTGAIDSSWRSSS